MSARPVRGRKESPEGGRDTAGSFDLVLVIIAAALALLVPRLSKTGSAPGPSRSAEPVVPHGLSESGARRDMKGEPMQAIDRVDAERRHLEGLLKDRISFFLLFAPVLVAASYNIRDVAVRAGVLTTGTVVSFLLALAILRTHLFVELALTEILQDQTHPYTKYRSAVRFPPNANRLLIWIPFVLTAMFAWLTAVAFCTSAGADVAGGRSGGASTHAACRINGA